eukprot:5524130-Pyramimonas_sp.AAC.1
MFKDNEKFDGALKRCRDALSVKLNKKPGWSEAVFDGADFSLDSSSDLAAISATCESFQADCEEIQR